MIWSREGSFQRARTSSRPATWSKDLPRRASSSTTEAASSSTQPGSLEPPADSRSPPGPYEVSSLFVPRAYGPAALGARVEVLDGDRFVRLLCRLFSEHGWPTLRARSRRRSSSSALRRVDALLTDPTTVLPPSAWAVRKVRAYVPSHYAACIDTSPPKDASHLLSLLPTRAACRVPRQEPDRIDDEVVTKAREAGRIVVLGRSDTYCSRLATEEALRGRRGCLRTRSNPSSPHFGLVYRVAEAVNNLDPTTIWFDPYFPHGQSPAPGRAAGEHLSSALPGRAKPHGRGLAPK